MEFEACSFAGEVKDNSVDLQHVYLEPRPLCHDAFLEQLNMFAFWTCAAGYWPCPVKR